jgi:hypothetical protein
MAENVLLWFATIALCVLLAVMALAVVGIFVWLCVKAVKELREEDG